MSSYHEHARITWGSSQAYSNIKIKYLSGGNSAKSKASTSWNQTGMFYTTPA